MIEYQDSDLFSHLKQLENMIKYMKEQCSDTGQQAIKTVIPERREINKVSASVAPGHCLETTAQRGRSQTDFNGLTKIKRQNSEFKEAKAARILCSEILMRRGLNRETVRDP